MTNAVKNVHFKYHIVTVSVLAVLLLLSACGSSNGNDAPDQSGADMFRDPHPTFTPTADAPRPSQAPREQADVKLPSADEQEIVRSPQADQLDANSEAAPRAVVNAPLVNLRTRPDLNSEIAASVERGSEYDIVGRSADDEWWQVCCWDGQPIWVSQSLVDVDGNADLISTADEMAAPQPASATGGRQITGPNTTEFELESQEQFSEQNTVRIYLYLHDGDSALSGYSVRILKDGRVIPADKSFGGQPAFTWPFQDARQRHQNLKIEIPDVGPAGSWSVQPIDAGGSSVGPPAQFVLQENDPNQELYARYTLVK